MHAGLSSPLAYKIALRHEQGVSGKLLVDDACYYIIPLDTLIIKILKVAIFTTLARGLSARLGNECVALRHLRNAAHLFGYNVKLVPGLTLMSICIGAVLILLLIIV